MLARETNLGSIRLAHLLRSRFAITLSPYTARNILRRYRIRCRKRQSKSGCSRYWADVRAFAPFSFWQVDTKYIADQDTLPAQAYAAVLQNRLPRYQFTAIDVRSRVRFMAFAYSLSFANGLAFLLLVESWLRAFGVQGRIILQTDNGAEFGSPANSRKRKLMQSVIFAPRQVTLLSIPEGKKEATVTWKGRIGPTTRSSTSLIWQP